MDLKNKVVIITGGSRGFGKSLAKAFSTVCNNKIYRQVLPGKYA